MAAVITDHRVAVDDELLADFRRLPTNRRKRVKHLVARYRVACELSVGRCRDRCEWWGAEASRRWFALKEAVEKESRFANAQSA